MNPPKANLDQIFESHIRSLAVTHQPGTLRAYRSAAHRFLRYLHHAFPRLRRLAQLRRDPHLLGWFRCPCEQDPPLCNQTRRQHLIHIRRLVEDLAAHGHPVQPGLIRSKDLPRGDRRPPKLLPLEDDQRLQQELRRTDNLLSNLLLLTRFTGIRIGECIRLPLDCLCQVGPDQVGAPRPPRQVAHRTLRSRRCRGSGHHSTHSGLAPSGPAGTFGPIGRLCYLMVARGARITASLKPWLMPPREPVARLLSPLTALDTMPRPGLCREDLNGAL